MSLGRRLYLSAVIAAIETYLLLAYQLVVPFPFSPWKIPVAFGPEANLVVPAAFVGASMALPTWIARRWSKAGRYALVAGVAATAGLVVGWHLGWRAWGWLFNICGMSADRTALAEMLRDVGPVCGSFVGALVGVSVVDGHSTAISATHRA